MDETSFRGRLEAGWRARSAPVLAWLEERGVGPDQVTLAGLVVSAAAALPVLAGWFWLAGLLYLAGSAMDALDGALARRAGTATPFGAVLDSTADRIGEGLLLVALAVRFAAEGAPGAAAGAGLALVASLLTSYVKARVEALGASCEVGVATRVERVLIVGVGLLVHRPAVAVWLVAVVASITVAQRLLAAQRALR